MRAWQCRRKEVEALAEYLAVCLSALSRPGEQIVGTGDAGGRGCLSEAALKAKVNIVNSNVFSVNYYYVNCCGLIEEIRNLVKEDIIIMIKYCRSLWSEICSIVREYRISNTPLASGVMMSAYVYWSPPAQLIRPCFMR